MTSANRNRSFLICIPFISLSCLIVLASTSYSLLNNIGESRHPCLIPNLREKTFSFSTLNIQGFFLEAVYHLREVSFHS